MGVTPEEVRRVVELARLRLSDDEVEQRVRELVAILDHVGALDGVEPGGGVATDGVAPLRPDQPGSDPLERSPGDLAPGFDDGFFTVPRLASHADPVREEGPDRTAEPSRGGEGPDRDGDAAEGAAR